MVSNPETARNFGKDTAGKSILQNCFSIRACCRSDFLEIAPCPVGWGLSGVSAEGRVEGSLGLEPAHIGKFAYFQLGVTSHTFDGVAYSVGVHELAEVHSAVFAYGLGDIDLVGKNLFCEFDQSKIVVQERHLVLKILLYPFEYGLIDDQFLVVVQFPLTEQVNVGGGDFPGKLVNYHEGFR